MQMRRRLLVILLIVSACLAWGGVPQGNPEERMIYGKVTDKSGNPVPNVEVVLEYIPFGMLGRRGTWVIKKVTRTSATGEYKFSAKGKTVEQELPWGNYRLRFKYPGWEEVTEQTEIGLYLSSPEGTPKYVQEVNVQVTPVVRPSPTPTATPRATPSPVTTPTPKAIPTPTRTPTPGASPNITPSPSPEIPPTEIDRILKSLDWGNIAFNVPDSMSLNEAKKVELLLGPSQSADELKTMVKGKGVEGGIEIERIQISDQMEANLTGDGFSITDVLPARRAVSKTAVTEWKWDVRAIKSGKLRLHLTLNALVKVEGREQLYPIRTFDKEYVVDVPWQEKPFFSFIGRNWQWLWTTILIPIGAWLWNRKRKKVKKAGFV
jgi:hypothetical protein